MRANFLAALPEAERAAFLRDNPPFDCVLCGDHFDYAETEYEKRGVCYACTETLANHWWRAHSGAWLTWPNPQRDRSGAQKKKIKPSVRFKVYERDGFKCVYCGGRKDLTLDHVAAESGGGRTEASNLVTACRTCNSKKGTKSLVDFWDVRT